MSAKKSLCLMKTTTAIQNVGWIYLCNIWLTGFVDISGEKRQKCRTTVRDKDSVQYCSDGIENGHDGKRNEGDSKKS